MEDRNSWAEDLEDREDLKRQFLILFVDTV